MSYGQLPLRDTIPAIVHVDGEYIKAGKGLAELLERPQLHLRPCYGLKAGSERTFDNYLIGSALLDAISALQPDFVAELDLRPDGKRHYAGQDTSSGGVETSIEVFWPFEKAGSSKGKEKRVEEDWQGREAILQHIFFREFGLQPSSNKCNLLLIPPSSQSISSPSTLANYSRIAFESLNTPAFQVLDVSVAALYGTGAITGLNIHIGLERTQISVVTDSTVRWEAGLSVGVGKVHCERYLADLLLASQAGTTGVADAAAAATAPRTTVRSQLEELVRSRPQDMSSVSEDEALRRLALVLARAILSGDQEDGKPSIEVPPAGEGKNAALAELGNADEEEGMFNVAKMLTQADASKSIQQLKESKTKKAAAAATAAEKIAAERNAAAQAAAAADIKTYALPAACGYLDAKGKPVRITVGNIRHRACEPLYEQLDVAAYGEGRTIPDGIAAVLAGLEPAMRFSVKESVVFTGELAKIVSLPFAIASYLGRYLLSGQDRDSDFQIDRLRVLKLPDYFAWFKGHPTDVAPFLGGCLAAKHMFTDDKRHCISKTEYNKHGPDAINLVLE